MRYRQHPRTGEAISEIGVGTSSLHQMSTEEAVKAVQSAYAGGVNYFDLASGDGAAFSIVGEALRDVRSNVLYQLHFGADYSKGAYGWSLDLDTVKRSVEWQLKTLKTNFIDYGFIHCQDEMSDWETYQKNGIYQYILDLQSQGTVRHIGLSSHTPAVIQRILDDVPVDMLMFSINPAYDYGHGEFANGSVDERQAVYRRCEKEKIGISVMKPFSGGQLLDAAQSPFHVALTPYQCIRYALDRPSALTALAGIQSVAQVEDLLQYENQPEEALDYSVISRLTPRDAEGKCVYCNHCKPCPAGLDIGLINKYYDLAQAGDSLASEHYRTLSKTAKDCVACGHCDKRCPFHVRQSRRMREIAAYFEEK